MVYKVLEPIFGSGIASAPAHIWTGHRKMIAPIFKTVNLRKFVDIFVEEASMLTEELEKVEHNENEIFFLKPLEKCALKIACGTMIGIKVEENILDKTVEAFERMKEIIRARFRNPFLIPDFIFNLTSMGKMQREILIFVQSFIDKMIQQWANESNTTNVNDSKAHKRLVDILMNSTDKEFIEKDIFYNLFTMLVTASDTTAVTMYFVIFMLANFPEIQEKVYKELLEIYGTQTPKAAPVKYEDLQHMNYLERVIKETLRIFPTVPIIARQVTEDFKIGDIVLPKHTDILIPFIQMHRNKKYWPNPLVFDPDRFLPENIKNYHLFYFTPFSDGPRNCIGMRYGMMSMKAILATLIRSFIFKVNETIEIDKIKLNMDIVLSTLEPVKIKLKKRNP
ncbi:cytochrome P450 4c21-like [Solenopsis invicta]|nr:cytochrome P450 4c21-like [Solenopsis invicta]